MAGHKFQDLVEAIGASFLAAASLVEKQHIAAFKKYFRVEKDAKTGKPAYVARTYPLRIPDLDGDGKSEYEVEVPQIALIPISSLVIDKIELEFNARLSDFGESNAEGDVGTVRMELMGSGESKDKSNVKVSISVKSADPPEGLVKINNNILKHIP